MALEPNEHPKDILVKIHERVKADLEKKTLAKEAADIQGILKEIKRVASNLQQCEKSGNAVDAYLAAFLKQVIKESLPILNSDNTENKDAFFRRDNSVKVSGDVKIDDIVEYEMGLIFQALEKQKTNIKKQLQFYVLGGVSSSIDLTGVAEEQQKKTVEAMRVAAEKTAKDLNGKLPVVKRAIKADVGGASLDIEVKNVLEDKLQQLFELTQGKTFSIKNYSTVRDYKNLRLGLGGTSLYKALMGSLNLYLSDPIKSNSLIYSGMQVLSGEQKKRDGEEVAKAISQHFAHLRFMYELAGGGLVNQGSGKMVDYIIYNDPNSDNIAVRDTFSIILEQMNNNRRQLFGEEITIAASKIFANPVKEES